MYTYLSAHTNLHIPICTLTYLVSAHRSTWIIIYKMLWSAQNFSAQTFYLSAQCTTYLLYLHLVQLKSEIWISRLRARNLKIQIVQIGFCFVQAFTMHQMQFFQGMFHVIACFTTIFTTFTLYTVQHNMSTSLIHRL